jgi:hypothetical protein
MQVIQTLDPSGAPPLHLEVWHKVLREYTSWHLIPDDETSRIDQGPVSEWQVNKRRRAELLTLEEGSKTLDEESLEAEHGDDAGLSSSTEDQEDHVGLLDRNSTCHTGTVRKLENTAT